MSIAWRKNWRPLLALAFTLMILGVAVLLVVFYGPKYQNGRAQGEQIVSLQNLLAEEGCDLLLMQAPYRQRDWRDTASLISKIRQRLSTLAFSIGYRRTGAERLDIRSAFDEIVDDPKNFRDKIHLSREGTTGFGKATLPHLRAHFADRELPFPENIVIAGDCFSEDMVSALSFHDPDTRYLAARAYANSSTAIQLVFKFKDIYLKETDLVIWFRPEIFMTYHDPPTLDLSPLTSGQASTQMRVQTTSDLGHDKYTFHEIKGKLEYPNAAGEIMATDEAGRSIVLCAYLARDRERTGFEAIQLGDQVIATLQPFESYLAENPKEAGMYFFRREDDLLAPRYWVHEWAKTDFTGEKALRQAGEID